MAKPPLHQPVVMLPDPEQVAPQSTDDLVLRGWSYYAHHEYEKAAADFDRAVQAMPESIDINYAYGLALKAAGRDTDAVKYFNRVLENLPSLDNRVRASMLSRLAQGQINHIQIGDWNLEKEIWHTTR